ncbi:MAG: FAD-binding oxidoreductase, partial [Burkholderiales bacterium]|nr:FAD-binding oxidoreductase [Burkholderiales bacterium]
MENIQLFKRFTDELIQSGFMGDIHSDRANRILNATDNSIYEVMPLGIIEPRCENDVKLMCKIASTELYHSLTFTARGGGTGTNGQSLTEGIVVDMSRYMTNILDFNPAELTITVEPGLVLSKLNQFLLPHGLFFAPHVSTENRATIG